MLECRACLRRCMLAVSPDAALLSRPALRHRPPVARGACGFRTTPPPRRPYSNGAAETSAAPQYDFLATAQKTPGDGAWETSHAARKQNAEVRQEIRKVATPAEPEMSKIYRELDNLEDPLKLAKRVHWLLEHGKEQTACAMLNVASGRMKCTISWNHLIDYQMSRGRSAAAMKAYNDMKKRGQQPDAHTFILLFRGLANYAHHGLSLSRALSLYHSMFAEKSSVEPNIKHTNAVLKVCARANDMDALWGIISKIPNRGPNAADNLTYTTILNALQKNILLSAVQGESQLQRAYRIEHVVTDGRRIWEDVVRKWRSGNILIDEELVASMGRLLLLGQRPRDWDDVLSLVEQTTGIPRAVPRLGTPERAAKGLPAIQAPHIPAEVKADDEHFEPSDDRGSELDPFPVPAAGAGDKKPSLAYVKPGNNLVSVIMEACLKTLASGAAETYWNQLTLPSGCAIAPDMDNLNSYLRVLRQSRASARAAELLCSSPRTQHLAPFERKTYRIAMSACLRNGRNEALTPFLKNATAILDLMKRHLRNPDVTTLRMYMDLAFSAPGPKTVVFALETISPAYVNLRSLLAFGDGEKGPPVTEREKLEAVKLTQRMIGCYDRLLSKGEVSARLEKTYRARKSKLAAYITRAHVRDKVGRARRENEVHLSHMRSQHGEGGTERGAQGEEL